MRHLLTLSDLTDAEVANIFAITEDLKSKYESGLREALLPGRVMALLFEKPSLRTRVSFESCMLHLGGGSLFLDDNVGFGKRESIADFGRVLSQYVDVVVVRARDHKTVVELAKHSTCSVINGLTNVEHPCQALADLYTIREHVGSLEGQTLAWVGDGNNVARSLAIACAKVGMQFVVASPEGYRLKEAFVAQVREQVPDAQIVLTDDPEVAVREATAVYTDVWVSMGQEAEKEQRKLDFARYQVNSALMEKAPTGALFMHCLPAHRGFEVTDEVLDGPQSIVVQQAGNRLHVQKGILAWLLASQS